LIGNYDIPKGIKVLLIIPKKSPVESHSREEENDLFKKNTPISEEDVGKISTCVLSGVIPGIIRNDYKQFVKNIMCISSLGTKRIELELNFNFIKNVQKQLEEIIDFKYERNGKACFSLINGAGEEIDEFITSEKEISFSKKIPWLGLSSLGSSLYSFIRLKNKKDLDELKNIIESKCPDREVIITEINNEKNKL